MPDLKLVSKYTLDEHLCDLPDCRHPDHNFVYFHPKCHPDAALAVAYDRVGQLLLIHCQECNADVAAMRIHEDDGPEVERRAAAPEDGDVRHVYGDRHNDECPEGREE